MKCKFELIGIVREDGWEQVQCPVCKTKVYINHAPEKVDSECGFVPVPDFGPGTELETIIRSLGIKEVSGCNCTALRDQMNVWGPNGCEQNLDKIIEELEKNAQKFKWPDRIKAAGNAVLSGLAFKLNWRDPFPDLVRMAIKNAREKPPGGGQTSGN